MEIAVQYVIVFEEYYTFLSLDKFVVFNVMGEWLFVKFKEHDWQLSNSFWIRGDARKLNKLTATHIDQSFSFINN
jgi:hypothetical protein